MVFRSNESYHTDGRQDHRARQWERANTMNWGKCISEGCKVNPVTGYRCIGDFCRFCCEKHHKELKHYELPVAPPAMRPGSGAFDAARLPEHYKQDDTPKVPVLGKLEPATTEEWPVELGSNFYFKEREVIDMLAEIDPDK